MEYKIAVCEDEREDAHALLSPVQKWGAQSGCRCAVSVFPSAEAFLFQYEEEKDYDILLLDIEMRGMSGIELARRIRRDHHPAEIIFITSHFEFFGEGYEVDALHYLVKPVSEEKLMAVLSKAAGRLMKTPCLLLHCGGETLKIRESDILYLEAALHYVTIYTKDGAYRVKQSLSSFSDQLSGVFYRAHRSYLLSLRHVLKISRTAVWMENGAEIPLARGKYDDIHRAFIAQN